MTQFDAQSVSTRVINRLKAKESHRDMLFYSTNRRLIDAFSEEIAYLAEYDEYLTRETKWKTARNRTSLVSEATFFNYQPHRKQGAQGYVKVGFDEDFVTSWSYNVDIPKWSVFSDGINSFTSVESRTINKGQTETSVKVVQGVPRVKSVTIQSSDIGQGLEYTYIKVDNDSVENNYYDLYVNGELWEQIRHIRDAETGDDKVYVIQNTIDFQGVEIQLGNDIFGKRVQPGDVIQFNYIETKGADGNILRKNSINQVESSFKDGLGNDVDIFCTNENYIANGTDYESIETIRANAPQSYQTADRAMSSSDYKVILEMDQSVSRAIVWGELEINEDRGNPPGTYLPQEENMIYISAFYIDPETDRGRIINDAEKSDLRDLLNPRKGPTDIINFIDAEFINVIFHITPYVTDKRYSSEKVRENLEGALMEHYSIRNTGYGKNLRFSDYYAFIDSVDGVAYHRTSLSFNRITTFSSAYEMPININLANLKQDALNGKTVKVWIRDVTTGGDWFQVGEDDGGGNLVAVSGDYDLSISNIDYSDGTGYLIITFGLDQNYTHYEVRIDFELDEDTTQGDLVLTKRQQIFSYYDTVINQVVHQ